MNPHNELMLTVRQSLTTKKWEVIQGNELLDAFEKPYEAVSYAYAVAPKGVSVVIKIITERLE